MKPRSGLSSPEFDLVLACIRWPAGADTAARVRELAHRCIRWPHLLNVVHHHQVASLVSHNLEAFATDCVPPEQLADLRSAAVQNAHFCFQSISELVRLTQLFDGQKIGLRILKGAPLAVFAFGDATLRGAGDIDLLIDEKNLQEADRILRSEGYVRGEPDAWLTVRRLRSYMAYQKDFSYEHPKHGVMIDLHWRLFRNRRLPLNTGAGAAGLAWIRLGTQQIPILPWDRTFLYLCTHGALDGWLRAKWLADIGALLAKFSPGELDAILHEAGRQGMLSEVSAAILLCHQKLGIDQAPAGRFDPDDPAVARILRFANRLMAANDFCPIRERTPSTAWFVNELLLRRSFEYRVELVNRSLFRPRVWQKVNLPDSLFPVYAVLSPFEWVGFRIQRAASRLGAALDRRTEARPGKHAHRISRGLGLSSGGSGFASLGFADIGFLLEAATLLAFFRIALRFFPIQRLTCWMSDRAPEEHLQLDDQTRRTIRRVEWAVGAIARHAPFTFVCFPQSLAAYFMLRRRHIRSKLFYGVAREEHALKAHTWIKVGERTVVGGEAESRFTVLAIFP